MANFHCLIDIFFCQTWWRNQCDIPLVIWYPTPFYYLPLLHISNISNPHEQRIFCNGPRSVSDRFFCYHCSRIQNIQTNKQTHMDTWMQKKLFILPLHCLIVTLFGCRVSDLVCVRDLYTTNKCKIIPYIFLPWWHTMKREKFLTENNHMRIVLLGSNIQLFCNSKPFSFQLYQNKDCLEGYWHFNSNHTTRICY